MPRRLLTRMLILPKLRRRMPLTAAIFRLKRCAAETGRLPEEYQTFVAQVDKTAEDTYRYLNFNQLDQYTEKADGVIFQTAV